MANVDFSWLMRYGIHVAAISLHTVEPLIWVTENPKFTWFSSRHTFVFSQYIEARCQVENVYVVADRWCSNYIWVISNLFAY